MDFTALLLWFGNTLGTVLFFVVALSVIVAIHEFGHYIVGRWSGIHAEVFSLGFGPALWSRTDRRGTRWQVATLPFGGYVKFLGDANAASAAPDDATLARLSPDERRHTMHGAPLWARAATVAAGPVFNFILSVLVFTALVYANGVATDEPTISSLKPMPVENGLMPGDTIVAVNGIPTPDYAAMSKASDALPPQAVIEYRVERSGGPLTVSGPTLNPAMVGGLLPRSAANDAGLREGDVIVAAGGQPTPRFIDLQATVKASAGQPISLQVWRDGKIFETQLQARQRPVEAKDGGLETGYQIGIASGWMFDPATRSPRPSEALKIGARQTYGVVRSSFSAIWSIVAGRISSCSVNGAVGMAQATKVAANSGLASFIAWIAVLSTAIGMVNLFPVPVLDGGHLVFHAWEWATGRPPSNAALNVLMTVGLALVIALMVFGLTNDFICP